MHMYKHFDVYCMLMYQIVCNVLNGAVMYQMKQCLTVNSVVHT